MDLLRLPGKCRRIQRSTTLLVSPFETQSDDASVAIKVEGQVLIRFIEDSTTKHCVEITCES